MPGCNSPGCLSRAASSISYWILLNLSMDPCEQMKNRMTQLPFKTPRMRQWLTLLSGQMSWQLISFVQVAYATPPAPWCRYKCPVVRSELFNDTEAARESSFQYSWWVMTSLSIFWRLSVSGLVVLYTPWRAGRSSFPSVHQIPFGLDKGSEWFWHNWINYLYFLLIVTYLLLIYNFIVMCLFSMMYLNLFAYKWIILLHNIDWKAVNELEVKWPFSITCSIRYG